MYERFYNLRERPFALSPDPEYLYLSRVHREALDSIRYGIESRAGFIVITGAIGAGKTTLLQTILSRLDDRAVVARVVNTTLEARELLEAILLEFGVDTAGKSKPALLRDLGQFLVRHRAEGRRPLLVIDEAQNLGPQALEEVRLLSNLETEKSKLLQILLAGQPNLRETIASPELEQFRQRIAVSYHLTPLDRQETAAYINSRLAHAAIGVPPRFPADAADLVHQRSEGVPRIINVICDAALVFGYAEERHEIDLSLIRDVVTELESTGVLRPPTAREAPAGAMPASDGAASVRPAAVPLRPLAAPVHQMPAAAPVRDMPAAAPVREMPAAAAMREAPAALVPAAAAIAAAAVQPQGVDRLAEVHGESGQAQARTIQEANRVLSSIAGREEALAARERELAEQRRVLAEECRLLRERRLAAAAATVPAGPVTTPVPRVATPASRVAPPVAPTTARVAAPAARVGVPTGRVPQRPVAAAHFRSPRNESFLGWLRRMLTGWSHRAIESSRSLHGS